MAVNSLCIGRPPQTTIAPTHTWCLTVRSQALPKTGMVVLLGYQEHYDGATFDVILVGGQPAERLYVARWTDEIRTVRHRAAARVLLPRHRFGAAAAAAGGSACRGHATPHPRRALQSRAAAVRRPTRLSTDRGQRRLSVHGVATRRSSDQVMIVS